MKERKIEEHICECGNGKIVLEKIISGRLHSEKKKEIYSSITPCDVCGSTVDNCGTDLSLIF